METITILYLILLFGFGLLNYFYALSIIRELGTERKEIVFDFRWYVLKNLNRYKELTRGKYGRVGTAYYGYIGSLILLIMTLGLFLQALAR